MSEVATAYVTLLTRMPGVQRDIQTQIERGVSGSKGKVDAAFGGIFAGLGKIAGPAAIATGLGFATKAGLETAASMEQAKIAFETMLGSAEKADGFLKDLAAFAAKTPFEFPELQKAASSLVSAGFSAEKVIPIMTTLGDVTSGMGTGSEGVQRATVALQQMAAAGRITGEDLNQLRDAGVPVFDLLAAATGKSKEAIAQLAASGKLGKQEMEQLFQALETGKGLERFTGLMDKQSQSLTGIWSTFQDALNVGLGEAITPLIPAIKDGLGAAISALGVVMPVVADGLEALVSGVQGFFAAVSGGGVTSDGFTGWMEQLGVGAASAQVALGSLGVWIDTSVKPAFAGIVGAVQNFLTVALPIVQQFADGMRARMEPMMPTIQSIFGTIGEIVTGVMGLIQAIIERVTAAISFVWTNWGDGIMNVVSKVWSAVAGIVDGALKVIKGVISLVTNIIKGDWSAAWESIKSIVSGAWQAITSAVSGALGTLMEIIRGIPGAITGALGNLGTLLVDKGVDLVRGLINGISSMGGQLAGFVRQFVVDHIPGPVRDALGIASPSKVMAEQGRYIAQGLAVGITDGKRLVRAASRSLAGAVSLDTLSAAPVFAGGAGYGPPPVLHATVMLPDGRVLAETVNRHNVSRRS